MPSPPTTLHLPESLDKPSSTLTSTESEQDELNEVKHRNQISEHDNTEKSFKAALLALQAKIECMEVIQQNEDKERKSTNHLQEICCFDQQSSNIQNELKKDKLIESLRKQIDAYKKYTKDIKSELELTLDMLKEQGE